MHIKLSYRRSFGVNKRLLNLIILLLFVGLTTAQVRRPRANRDTRHYFYSNTTLAYSVLLDGYTNTHEMGGFSPQIGLGYSFRVPRFWLEVGVDAQYMSSYMDILDDVSDMRVRDTEGDVVIYHYNKDHWYDRQGLLYVGTPLMVGYHSLDGFTIGAGIKHSFRIYASTTNRIIYSTSATYEDYIDDFVGMPNHDYGTYDRRTWEKITSKVRNKLSLCFERGYTIYDNHLHYTSIKNRHAICKITGYLEYGLNSVILNHAEQDMYSINPANPSELNMVPFYLANSTRNNFNRPLVIGLRWT